MSGWRDDPLQPTLGALCRCIGALSGPRAGRGPPGHVVLVLKQREGQVLGARGLWSRRKGSEFSCPDR